MINTDMLVKLYDLPDDSELLCKLKDQGITIKRAMGLNISEILSYVKEEFFEIWTNEVSVSLHHLPTTCIIAVKDGKLIGFACYDATAKGFFGPTGVTKQYRHQGVGTALLLAALKSMREAGYGYAIIGWVSEAYDFYRKAVNAIPIPDSFPGVYENMINVPKE